MAIITMNSGLIFGGFGFQQIRYDYEEVSDSDGSSATRPLAPPRWMFSIKSPDAAGVDQAQFELWTTMMLALRGKVNHLAIWDINRPAPKGTMRGTITLAATAFVGDSTISITAGAGQAGTTLRAGDWLQLGSGLQSQLVMVTNGPYTANGSGVITGMSIEPPIRPGSSLSSGASVTWDKAKCHVKRTGKSFGWDYIPGLNTARGFSADLLENWQ